MSRMAALMGMPHGYNSDTEYHFREEDTDAIVQVAAYHREDYCRSVIWFPPHEHVGIRQSITTPFPRTSSMGLGSLDVLPLELFCDVLLRLDMHSLLKFRQTNLRSRQSVDSLKQYQVVVSHGLNLLCALFRTRLAIDVSLLDFYHALCTKACTLCGEFGGYISLLAWRRCCFKCVHDGLSLEMGVRSLASVRKHFRLPAAELAQLRSFKTLPGTYMMGKVACKFPVTVVSFYHAVLASGREPYDTTRAQQSVWERDDKYNFMGSCALPYYDRQTGKVDHGMSCAGCLLALEKDIASRLELCTAFEARDKLYGQDGFLRHFRWCEQAQLLWSSSEQGNILPAELPEAVRRGGMSWETKMAETAPRSHSEVLPG
ncbi:hypothetical protein B0H66DRAFT_565338 [Apodospora peruviana]|uniref:F-box domain-containing protein n=1 Tax=Apodospora peruviana TaxID=516989 RepID=A0AAE0HZ04_9PEZI|nr:hypothetical protein B0H66DRAFT_565338 [Apodospora peruviana]